MLICASDIITVCNNVLALWLFIYGNLFFLFPKGKRNKEARVGVTFLVCVFSSLPGRKVPGVPFHSVEGFPPTCLEHHIPVELSCNALKGPFQRIATLK